MAAGAETAGCMATGPVLAGTLTLAVWDTSAVVVARGAEVLGAVVAGAEEVEAAGAVATSCEESVASVSVGLGPLTHCP